MLLAHWGVVLIRDLEKVWALALVVGSSSCTMAAPSVPAPKQRAASEVASSPSGESDSTSVGYSEPPPEPEPEAPFVLHKPEVKPEFIKVTVPRRQWSKLAQPAGVWIDPPPESLLASAKSIGKPVMLMSTDSGLWLQAWDDPWRRQLTSVVDMHALYDPRTAIVLYTADDQLWAIDLAAPVADGELPTSGFAGQGRLGEE